MPRQQKIIKEQENPKPPIAPNHKTKPGDPAFAGAPFNTRYGIPGFVKYPGAHKSYQKKPYV